MVESGSLPEGTVRMAPEAAVEFVSGAFSSAGVPPEDAALVADVLVSADLRGIRSHGLGRLSYLLVRLVGGVISARPQMELTSGSNTTAVLDADNAIGVVAASRAMDEAVSMAGEHGSGFVAVRQSSHFGYAGYWARRAMRQGFIGISLANSGRRVAPTFGIDSILGTNPVSVAIAGGEDGTDFLLDMATSAVAVGKIETALREGRSIPDGWVSRDAGTPDLDANGTLTYDAPLLPLGGAGGESGGHKGYGLSMMAELLCGALTGSPLSDRIAGASGEAAPAMGHFMGAISVSGFRPQSAVQADMATTFDLIRGSGKEPGHDRIFIHGEPEDMAEEEHRRIGIPITPSVLEQLHRWNDHFALGHDLP